MPSPAAAKFTIPGRQIVAVEHPMIVKNIDKALKTFGYAGPSKHILNSQDSDNCMPLYLRPSDRTCAPILSHNASCTNVLLKVTVPKRTGRKRKRGSQDPYAQFSSGEEPVPTEEALPDDQSPELQSHSRLDNPRKLLRILRDNVDKYVIEPIGSIEATHRYRGLADFHQSTTHQDFMTRFREYVLPQDPEKMRKFQFNPSKGPVRNEELIPPPSFTDKVLPFNWVYHQNPTVKVMTDPSTGDVTLINMSTSNKLLTQYIRHDIEIVPSEPPLPPPNDPIINNVIKELRTALEERPIWTRRALQNRIRDVPGVYLMRAALQYVGYQFRGGPWRDSIIKWGVDPRKDRKYRIYQTLFFKIYNRPEDRQPGDPWHDVRSEYTRTANRHTLSKDSHIFDGKSISLDGKVWQVCDITDPLIKFVASTEQLRETCDIDSDGWFCNGTWAKIKGIMKTKIGGIRAGREIQDEEFGPALAYPDVVELNAQRKSVTVPLPDWRLDVEDVNEMMKKGITTSITDSGLRKRRVKGRAYKKNQNGRRPRKPLWRTGPKRKIKRAIASGEADSEKAEILPLDPRLFEPSENEMGVNYPKRVDLDEDSDGTETSMDELDEAIEGEADDEGEDDDDEGEDDDDDDGEDNDDEGEEDDEERDEEEEEEDDDDDVDDDVDDVDDDVDEGDEDVSDIVGYDEDVGMSDDEDEDEDEDEAQDIDEYAAIDEVDYIHC